MNLRKWMVVLGLTVLASVAGDIWTIEGVVQDYSGRPATNLTVRAQDLDALVPEQTTRTDKQGVYRFKLDPRAWNVRVDPDELIARGFFCAPSLGVVVCDGADTNSCGLGWYPPGFLVISSNSLPSLPVLTIVPLRPTFAGPLLETNGTARLSMTFDTTFLPLQVVRQYRVEASEEMTNWIAISTNDLVLSPIEVVDPRPKSGGQRFYRAVLVEP